MHFASDNAGPAHPQVMAALAEAAGRRAAPYGRDTVTAVAVARLRTVFEAPEAAVYFVATGTAANALALATLGAPWQTVFCAQHAHIDEDECGAPEFFSGGAKLTTVATSDAKIDPGALKSAMGSEVHRGIQGVQVGPLSVTQATERGTVYRLDELRALTAIARAHGQPVHLDGARFANALVRLGCTPAQMTWQAGIDAVSFGGTKNGCPGVEAVILFDPARAWEFELRRKRAGHLVSRHTLLAAQMLGYLENDLWLDLARAANAAADRLSHGLAQGNQATLAFPTEANSVFAHWPRRTHQALRAAGAEYLMWNDDLEEGSDPDAPLLARLVCDWSLRNEDIDRFLALF